MTTHPVRNAGFDDDAAAYDARRNNWLNRRRLEFIVRALGPLRPGATVVEIGSGTGAALVELARRYPDVDFVGVEPLAAYVEFTRRRITQAGVNNVRVHEGVAEQLSDVLPGVRADVIVSNDVLHHVDDEERVAVATRAIVSTGARWIALEPSWLNPYVVWYHVRTDGERLFHPRRFLAAAQGAGWRARHRSYLFLVPSAIKQPPPWLQAAERRLERIPGLAGGVALILQAS